MQAETRHGGGTKITKATKTTKKTQWVFLVIFVNFVALVPPPWRVSPQAQQETQPRPPVFRAGAHYVRVDAYPTGKDGKIVEGLTKDDFEIYEDGQLQAIEGAEFITFDTWTPDAERKDPRTQQEAYDLAADPSWRVFVIIIDPMAYGLEGRHYMREPLHQFIDRNLGPRDLFGLLSTESSWTDLVLGQKTAVANAVIDSRQWINPPAPEFDERLLPYFECGLGAMIGRKKLDDTYTLLEGLVKLLGLVRQEKKSIVFVSNGLSQPGEARETSTLGTAPRIPGVGITNGRIGELTRGDRVGGPTKESFCAAERMRLANLDFAERFRDLLKDARQGNVAFYPISPAGLQGFPFTPRGGIDMNAYHAQQRRADSLLTLASETDGIAIVNTNDLAGGMRRIANDIQSYYVLGYYTTNTKWDGRVRSIKVRLKPKSPSTRLGTGDTIRARRQYRGPTLEEIAAFSNPSTARAPLPPSAEETALAALARARPDGSTLPPTAPAGTEPAPSLVGDPAAFRNGAPVAVLNCERTDKIRVEWTALATIDTRQVRLLDRTGRPLPIPLALMDNDSGEPRRLVTELALAPLGRGDYLIELTAGAGTVSERKLLALRVR